MGCCEGVAGNAAVASGRSGAETAAGRRLARRRPKSFGAEAQHTSAFIREGRDIEKPVLILSMQLRRILLFDGEGGGELAAPVGLFDHRPQATGFLVDLVHRRICAAEAGAIFFAGGMVFIKCACVAGCLAHSWLLFEVEMLLAQGNMGPHWA